MCDHFKTGTSCSAEAESFGKVSRDWYLATALYDAIDDKDIRQVTLLLIEKHANPNVIIPEYEVSPLHFAVGHSCESFGREVTKLILRNGGDPNVKGQDGITPVQVAAAWNRTSIIRLLLSYGADPWITDDSLKNAFHYAEEQYSWDSVKALEIHRKTLFDSYSDKTTPSYTLNLEKVIIYGNDVQAEYKPEANAKISTDPGKHSVGTQTSFICTSHISLHTAGKCEQKRKPCNQNNVLNSQTDDTSGNERLDTQDEYDWCKIVDQQNFLTDSSKCKIQRHRKGKLYEYNPANLDDAILIPDDVELSKRMKNITLRKTNKEGIYKHSLISEDEWDGDVFRGGISDDQEVVNITNLISEDGFGPAKLGNGFSTGLKRDDQKIQPIFGKHFEINAENDDSLKKGNNSILNSLFTEESESADSTKYQTCIEQPALGRRNVPIAYSSEDATQTDNTFEDEGVEDITELYKYVDYEEGVVLIEERLSSTNKSFRGPEMTELIKNSDEDEERNNDKSVQTSEGSSYDTDNLRHQLKCRGFNPGPITTTTKTLYLKKLKKIKRQSIGLNVPPLQLPCFSSDLQQLLNKDETTDRWKGVLSKWSNLETEMCDYIADNGAEVKYRGGASKTSFTYLMLDPRVTMNLPRRSENLELQDTWEIFVNSIFYIGKGKSHRPYWHLYEALSTWNRAEISNRRNCTLKERHILDIWESGLGVVCLHAFQHITPAEALTREAAMIDAVGLARLKNEKCGTYFGQLSKWSKQRKQRLGCCLLYRAMMIFLADGERQLKPGDIG